MEISSVHKYFIFNLYLLTYFFSMLIHKNVRTELTIHSPLENTSAIVNRAVRVTTVHRKVKLNQQLNVHQAIFVRRVQGMSSLTLVRWVITGTRQQPFPVLIAVFVCLECIVILKDYRILKIVQRWVWKCWEFLFFWTPLEIKKSWK